MRCTISAPCSLYLHSVSSLHCLADVTHAGWPHQRSESSRLFLLLTIRHHLAWTWTRCSQTSLSLVHLCHPLQPETAVPAGRSETPSRVVRSKPEQAAAQSTILLQHFRNVHLIPLCSERENLFMHITYNSEKRWFLNLANMFQGLINNDCYWSFHLCDCLLSAWI